MITKINLLYFRKFSNTEVNIGKNITVISGMNGTGKSSILGWLRQCSVYTNKNINIGSKTFDSQLNTIFKFCSQNDYKNKYQVDITYINSEEKVQTLKIETRYIKSENRYKIDYDGRGRGLYYPAIYIGLERLLPINSAKKISNSNYINNYNNYIAKILAEIFSETKETYEIQQSIADNKKTLTLKTKDFDARGNSAGQENLSQLINLICLFQELKRQEKDKYRGGMILIDELETTLYPGAVIRLLEVLIRKSKELALQIIFTSHSIEVLKYLMNESKKSDLDVQINFLIKEDNRIKNKTNRDFPYISSKLLSIPVPNLIEQKKIFLCEDEFAMKWINNMLNGNELKKILKIENIPADWGTLQKLSKSKSSLFKDINFILDGDVDLPEKKQKQNIIFLPGKEQPETIFYTHIKELKEDDSFFNDDKNLTHSICFQNHRYNAKNWINDKSLISFFGKNYSRLFNRWKKDNKNLVDKFLSDLNQCYINTTKNK